MESDGGPDSDDEVSEFLIDCHYSKSGFSTSEPEVKGRLAQIGRVLGEHPGGPSFYCRRHQTWVFLAFSEFSAFLFPVQQSFRFEEPTACSGRNT